MRQCVITRTSPAHRHPEWQTSINTVDQADDKLICVAVQFSRCCVQLRLPCHGVTSGALECTGRLILSHWVGHISVQHTGPQTNALIPMESS